jgi:hypothetical protein
MSDPRLIRLELACNNALIVAKPALTILANYLESNNPQNNADYSSNILVPLKGSTSSSTSANSIIGIIRKAVSDEFSKVYVTDVEYKTTVKNYLRIILTTADGWGIFDSQQIWRGDTPINSGVGTQVNCLYNSPFVGNIANGGKNSIISTKGSDGVILMPDSHTTRIAFIQSALNANGIGREVKMAKGGFNTKEWRVCYRLHNGNDDAVAFLAVSIYNPSDC